MIDLIARALAPLLSCIFPATGRHRDTSRRVQRRRRLVLLLATYGIDVGPRRIHGVVVREAR